MQWDYKDQLKEVDLGGGGTAYYVYDASGERVRKVIEKTGGIVEQRIYLGGWEVYRKTISGNLNFERETLRISDDQKAIANIETKTVQNDMDILPHPAIRYQYDNHLGSTCLELDDAAAIISYEEYHPFGTTSYRSGRTETEVSLKRYKYVGKERDEETGLYYYGARYYAGWLGRFVSVDALASQFPQFSPFVYSNNNPLRYSDPTGMQSEDEVDQVHPPVGQQNPNINLPNYIRDYPIKADNTNLKLPDVNVYQIQEGNKNPFSNVFRSEPEIPSIGPDKKIEWAPEMIEQNRAYWELQRKIDEHIETQQALHPVSFGGKGFGVGAVPALYEGMKQMPSMMLQGLMLTKFKIPTYQKFAPYTKGLFSGSNHNALRGGAFRILKKSININNRIVDIAEPSLNILFKGKDLESAYKHISELDSIPKPK